MKKTVNENIKRIREAVENDKLVVFIGSGVSSNSDLPSWSGLIRDFSESMGLSVKKELGVDDYLRIAQYFYNERGLKEYYDCINNKFSRKVTYNKIHENILSLNPAHIVTTNYDDLIEQAIEDSQLVFDVVCEDIDLPYTPNGRLLIKMHGDLKRKNIVLKEDDYLLYSQRFKLIETFIKSLFVNHVVLFIGYSLQDMDLKLIMKWVKDILGEHFQRAYFLDADEEEKGQVEINYFKNLGVNIINKFMIDEEYQNMIVEGLQSQKGKNIVRCINYIMNFENNPVDIIDYFFNRLSIFKDLHRLRLKDIIEALGVKIIYSIQNNNFIEVISNEESKGLETLLNEFIVLDSSENNNEKGFYDKVNKADFVKSIFLNADIYGIIINQSDKEDGNISYEFQKEHRSSELDILNCLKLNNFIEIKLYCEQTYKPIKHHKNNYFNELIRAYANYLMHRYVSAYEILKKLSKKAYRDKEYTVFYICEFNKKQLARFISNRFGIGETVYEEHINRISEEVKEENKNVDLRELYYLLPKKERATVNFLNDVIINESYFNDKKVRIIELKEKVEREVTTLFVGISTSPNGITELKREVHEFWEYTHNYFLMVDEYSDIRNYYFNYISALLSTYSKEKEEIDEESMIFSKEITHTMPDYKFDRLDLFIIYRYIENKELLKLLDEYNIDKIATAVPNIYFIGSFHNVVQSYISINYTRHLTNLICNMIAVGSKLTLTDDELDKFFDYILLLIEKGQIKTEIYKALNYSIIKMYENNLINLDFINKLITIFIEKLLNIENNNNNQGGWEIEAISQTNLINNLTIIFSSTNENDRLVSDELLKKLIHSIRYCELKGYKYAIVTELLIPAFKVVNQEMKEEIEDFIKDELSTKFNQRLYIDACINNIINTNKEYEQMLYNETISLIQDRSNTGVTTFPDPVVRNLRNIVNLFYNKKLISIEQFSNFKGYDNLFDFIFEPNIFDFEKFDVNWLLRFSNEFLEELSNIDVVKTGIRNKFKNEMIEKNLDKRLKEIYFTHFS
ncbi:SIR2 family protein [Tissierella pigra]|uniref:SIR2 family protein n=1 Tax=Tissierella pigra TaxID=2607614 RepID=UPI001C11A85F|nr:SIR2 family protein [Tissierella pigra]MBU5428166.1 SIR2 family protein [Tissierella pigra]